MGKASWHSLACTVAWTSLLSPLMSTLTDGALTFGIGDPDPFAMVNSEGIIEWHVFYLRSLQSGMYCDRQMTDLLRVSTVAVALTASSRHTCIMELVFYILRCTECTRLATWLVLTSVLYTLRVAYGKAHGTISSRPICCTGAFGTTPWSPRPTRPTRRSPTPTSRRTRDR